jgi:hypothetical protein
LLGCAGTEVVLAIITKIAGSHNIVREKSVTLEQNYPNPFNPATVIRFSTGTTGRATVTVYNQLGQIVATLFDNSVTANHEYAVSWNGKGLSSGVYFYTLQCNSVSVTRKMLLLK